MIHMLSGEFKLGYLLRLANVSKSGYYYFKESLSTYQRDALADDILNIQERSCYTYGYRKVTVILRKRGLHVNSKRVHRIMKEYGLLCVTRKKKHTYKKSAYHTAGDLIKRNFSAHAPKLKLVTDVTEIKVGRKKVYLSAILDCYNREIVAYKIMSRNNLQLVNQTFDKLMDKQHFLQGTIVHSDQGFQYTHKYFVTKLKSAGIRQSMSRKGTPLDNAVIECFFGILKSEVVYNPMRNISSEKELIETIEKWIEYYKEERIQAGLNYQAPITYKKVV